MPSVFTPVLAKHSKSFSLIDCISVGVDRMRRNFEPMRKQVEAPPRSELTDVTAKVLIYEAFIEGRLDAPRHLARSVHDLYFEPKYEEFRRRTIWSLSNAFTSAFKELDPSHNLRQRRNWGVFLNPPGRSDRQSRPLGRRVVSTAKRRSERSSRSCPSAANLFNGRPGLVALTFPYFVIPGQSSVRKGDAGNPSALKRLHSGLSAQA